MSQKGLAQRRCRAEADSPVSAFAPQLVILRTIDRGTRLHWHGCAENDHNVGIPSSSYDGHLQLVRQLRHGQHGDADTGRRARGQANGNARADMHAERPDVRIGITSLERARRELEHARNDLGGHRLWPFR
jgi:hypothetical protein